MDEFHGEARGCPFSFIALLKSSHGELWPYPNDWI